MAVRHPGETVKNCVIARSFRGPHKDEWSLWGEGEAKTLAAFFACEKCSMVSCALTPWQSVMPFRKRILTAAAQPQNDTLS